MFHSKNIQIYINFFTIIGVLALFSCSSREPIKVTSTASPISSISKTEEQKLKATTLTIGILSPPKYYQGLANYLKQQFGNKVQIVIDGDEKLSYEEARKRMINKEWDIAFPQSPMLSIAAKNNGYSYAARMFPDSPPYYQATLFTKANSPIKSISDLKPTHTIAMGDFNSASSFYVAAYDLYGKTLKVNMGHKSSKIKELVKTGKADVGAAAYIAVKNDENLRIIHLSKLIPGGNVYLSPKLSESDRQIITKILLNAPADIRKDANYGAGQEHDYSQLLKISERTEKILECNPFAKNPVDFFCGNKPKIMPDTPGKILEILGKINGWTKKGEFESFKLLGDKNKVYEVIIPEKIFNQIPDAPNSISIQGQNVKIINVTPQEQGGIIQLKVTEPNQFIVLKDISQSSTDSNYQVKQIDDGDTITVNDTSNQEIRVRFACIDTAETPKSDADKNTDNPADKNQFLWGNRAKERLESIIKVGDQVKLNIVDTDRYGRKVAEVRLGDGTFVQQILVKEGLAMVYRQYLKNCASADIVEQAEAEAKQQRLNIWADSQFTAPWDWRSRKRAAKKS
ncbi:PhnD/SsuA/transferrin family substrate-binding protein [Anabaena azotica FACHB-119]|uniref:PhnD/SsuA/transferrin family substrate-binding protein n=2 Tax=Anabaena azotica TaxID=197653 RepID=A0ABR8DFT5_9NOST|nr:PhnD/SsuA/transferrin family substrate-binding protein [Anabaena azotica FACHB-119]